MSLEKRIMADLKIAMKEKDQAALRAIRAVKAAILLLKTDGTHQEITAGDELKLLQKLVKQRKESLDIYEKQGREDLAIKEREEIKVISRYLPAQLSPDEIKDVVEKIVSDLGASSMKDMGRVMGLANQQMAGKADGKTIATLVKKMLQA